MSPFGESKITELLKSGIEKFSGEKKYIATADVTGSKITSTKTIITYTERPSRANMQPTEDTVWFAKMKDSRKLIRVSNKSKDLVDNYIFSTGFAGIKCINSLSYIWSFVLSDSFDNIKNSLCNGTTMQSINNENINKISILIPSESLLEKYELILNDIFNKVEKNNIENQKLAEIRDLLLPKLMSGEIRIPVEGGFNVRKEIL